MIIETGIYTLPLYLLLFTPFYCNCNLLWNGHFRVHVISNPLTSFSFFFSSPFKLGWCSLRNLQARLDLLNKMLQMLLPPLRRHPRGANHHNQAIIPAQRHLPLIPQPPTQTNASKTRELNPQAMAQQLKILVQMSIIIRILITTIPLPRMPVLITMLPTLVRAVSMVMAMKSRMRITITLMTSVLQSL